MLRKTSSKVFRSVERRIRHGWPGLVWGRISLISSNWRGLRELAYGSSLDETVPKKSYRRRLFDLILIATVSGEISGRYFALGLDVKGERLRDGFLPYKRFMALRDRRNRRKHTYRRFDHIALLQDKLVFYRYFLGSNLRIPTVYGVVGPASKSLSKKIEEFLDMASQRGEGDRIFMKPRLGIKGGGVFLVERKSGNVFVNRGESSLGSLDLSEDYICQPVIRQHEAVASLHPDSINTLRLVTVRDPVTSDVSVFFSYLRVGDNGNFTDNATGTSVVAPVCHSQGTLADIAYHLSGSLASHITEHPTSKASLVGISVPYYEEAVSLVISAHRWLPYLKSVGWDVVIQPDGPLLLEGNDDWGATGVMWMMPDFKERFTREIVG